MAKSVTYRATAIERLTSATIAALLTGAGKLVVAIDVAKTKMMAGFGREDGSVARLVRFESPHQTRAFVDLVMETGRTLGVSIEVLMEPTGTYGDGLRALLVSAGAKVFMLSPKRVYDAKEAFDGVPSLHDGKSCVVMAQMHRQGASRQYVEPSKEKVRFRALIRQREVYQNPLQMHLASSRDSLLGTGPSCCATWTFGDVGRRWSCWRLSVPRSGDSAPATPSAPGRSTAGSRSSGCSVDRSRCMRYRSGVTRSLVQDLALGLGSFRWGDTRATVRDTYPDADWGRVQPVYAFKKAFSIPVFEVSESLIGTAVIDPDTGGAQMVRVNVAVDAWPELAELARALGVPDVPDELGNDDVLSWQAGRVEVEIAMDFDLGGIYLRLERPIDTDTERNDDESVDDAENDDEENDDFDFDD